MKIDKLKPSPFCGSDDLEKLQDMHENYGAGYGRYMAGETLYNAGMTIADAAYFAAMHNALPGLLDTVRRAQPANEPLTLEQLRKMDNERVFVVLDDDVCIPALVAYNTENCSNEDDIVYLTNNLGGRSTYEDMLEMGAKFYLRPPEKSSDHTES